MSDTATHCECGWRLPQAWRVVVRRPSWPADEVDEDPELGAPLFLVVTCPECGAELEHEAKQDEPH